MMTDARVMSIDELKAFLYSSDVLTFKQAGGQQAGGSDLHLTLNTGKGTGSHLRKRRQKPEVRKARGQAYT